MGAAKQALIFARTLTDFWKRERAPLPPNLRVGKRGSSCMSGGSAERC